MSGHRPWEEVRAEVAALRERAGIPAQLDWAADVARLGELTRASPRAEFVRERGYPPTTAAHDHAYVPELDGANPAFDRDRLLALVWMSRWHAVPDDLVGGWAVVTDCDQVARLSDLDLPAGERAVADGVLTRGLAVHIAALHNAALDALLPEPTEEDDDG